MSGAYETLLYDVDDAIATITLNRPERLNTIVPPMPDELEQAVHAAVADQHVKVIVLRGAGRSFCAGFDFGGGFHHWDEELTTDGAWDPGKDFVHGHRAELRPDAEVHEHLARAQAGDRPGARLVRGRRQRHGALRRPRDRERGRPHRHALLAHVGLLPHGHVALPAGPDEGQGAGADPATRCPAREAAEIGLINAAVPFERLEDEVRARAEKLASLPASQLAAMKLIVNQAYENMGLASTQLLGPILDGLMRNTPDALRFVELAESEGVQAAVARRDGPFGDYSQAPPEDRPDPSNVVE